MAETSQEAEFQFQEEDTSNSGLLTSEQAGFAFGEDTEESDEAGMGFRPSEFPADDYTGMKEATDQRRQEIESGKENAIRTAIESHGGKYSNEDFGDFWTETKIAALDKFDDKQRAFLREYPRGDLIQVPVDGSVKLYGRTNATSPYQEVGGIGPSLTAASPEIAGAVIGGLPRAAATGIAGAAGLSSLGKIGKDEYLRSQGLLTEDRSKTYGKGFGLGITEGALEGTMRGLGFLGKVAKSVKGSEVPVERGMKEFMAEEGLKEPVLGQVSEAPVIRQMFSQVSGTSAVPKKVTGEQSRSLLKAFNSKMSLEELSNFSNEEIDRVLAASTRELNQLVKKGARDRLTAGKDIQRGLEAFESSSREWVSRKYERAFAAAEKGGGRIKFDISNAQKGFKEVFEDIRGKGQVQRGEGGRFAPGEEVRINSLQDLDPKLRSQVGRLMQLNPTLSGYKGKNGFEQAKALRTNFYDLMQSDDAQTRRIATKIYSELTDSMKRPFNADKEFVNRFVSASKANAWRENILRDGVVAETLSTTSDPSLIAKKYFQQDRREELKLIKRLVPEKRWDSFRNHFKNDLLDDPKKISSKLSKFDQRTLDTMLSKEEQAAIRMYEKQSNLVDKSMLRQVQETALANHDKALKMVRDADVDEINKMIRLSDGGKNSAFAKSLKEGIYFDVLKHSHETIDGKELINPRRLKERIRWWRDQGKTKAVMNEKDWGRLENMEKYASMVEHGSADVGGQIRAASLASDVRKFWKPWAQFGAGLTLASDAATARILSRHQDFLNKIPATEKLDSAKLRGAARALTAMAYSMQSPGDPAQRTPGVSEPRFTPEDK